MEPIYQLRFYCFVTGVVTSIFALISLTKAKRCIKNSDYRKYEKWEGIQSTFFCLAFFSIVAGIFTFPFEGLLNAIKNAVGA